MVYVENDLKCDNCKQKGDALILVNVGNNKTAKVCYSCLRSSFWRFCREGGYWRKVFNKPAFNNAEIKVERRGRHRVGGKL